MRAHAQGTGSSIDFLTPLSAATRMLAGLPQIISGDGRFFDKDGQRQQLAGSGGGGASHAAGAPAFNDAGVRLLFDYPADKY